MLAVDSEGNVIEIGDTVYYNVRAKGTKFRWVEMGTVYGFGAADSAPWLTVVKIEALETGEKLWRRGEAIALAPGVDAP